MAVTLRKPLERRVREGHPWVWRDALATPPELPEGTPVLLRARDGRPLAAGFWDARSPIAVRLLTTEIGRGGLAPGDEAGLAALVQARLRGALAARTARLDPRITDAFRWVHGEADRLPGLHVDLYRDVASVRFDGAGARAFYTGRGGLPGTLAAAAVPLVLGPVIEREGRRLLAGEVAEQADGFEVRENGLRFSVDLLRGQKGGLFLDQRENRALVRERAGGRSVLNLFGYTGGFSVYAAAGGARRTDTVDLARPAVDAARENFRRNRLPVEEAGFFAEDAFEFLTQAAARGQRWDLVISDPPSFAPRHSALPAARKAYRRLHRLAAAVTAPGGLLFPASCSSHFPRPEFVASVEEGVRAAGRRATIEELRGAGFDHPTVPWFPEGDYLKFAACRLD